MAREGALTAASGFRFFIRFFIRFPDPDRFLPLLDRLMCV